MTSKYWTISNNTGSIQTIVYWQHKFFLLQLINGQTIYLFMVKFFFILYLNLSVYLWQLCLYSKQRQTLPLISMCDNSIPVKTDCCLVIDWVINVCVANVNQFHLGLKKIAVFGAPRPTLDFCADPTTFFSIWQKKFYKKGNFCATFCKKQIENPSITARVIVVEK